MKKTVMLTAAVMMITSGCSNLRTNVPGSNLGISTNASFQADLKVGEKISGNCSVTKFLFFTFGDTGKEASGVTLDATNSVEERSLLAPLFSIFASADPVSKCARAAAYDAVTKHGADVIFAPRYISEISGIPFIYQTIDVKLTGYKATITGFKQLDTQAILTGKR